MNIKAFCLLLLFTSIVSAFPRGHLRRTLKAQSNEKRQLLPDCPFDIFDIIYPSTGVPLGVSVGRVPIPDIDHPFQEPGRTDQRGVCPGLNLMANYGYIPRNGIANWEQLVYGQMQCLGAGYGVAAFLATFGIALCGDPTSGLVSIGGPDSRTNGPFSCLLSTTPGGINAHDKMEIDGSLSCFDAYFCTDDSTTVFDSTKWAQEIAIANNVSQGLWNTNAINAMRDYQYQQGVLTNPEFLWAIPAQLLFYIGQGFCNSIMPSAEPDGTPGPATYDTVATFFGVTNDSHGNYYYNLGAGRLPPSSDGNWYRRGSPYNLVDAAQCALNGFLSGKPTPHAFGGNQNKTDTFTPGPTQFTQLSVNGTLCVLYELLLTNVPTTIDEELFSITSWVQYILDPIFANFGCFEEPY